MWLKTHKKKLLAAGLLAAVLAVAFWMGGPVAGQTPQGRQADAADAGSVDKDGAAPAPSGDEKPGGDSRVPAPSGDEKPGGDSQTPSPSEGEKPSGDGQAPAPSDGEKPGGDSQAPAPSDGQKPSGDGQTPSPSEGQKPSGDSQAPAPSEGQKPGGDSQVSAPSGAQEPDKTGAEPAPEKPEPVDDPVVGETACSCTISICCQTLLDNPDALSEEKRALVPSDGWILAPVTVTFYEGETVFNVLSRVCKQEKLHMEFTTTPVYDSAYIEGIGNLYEFDAGSLSGWMYKVGDWFPNYGCSRYQLQDGDTIAWVYTCDLGADVGGADAAAGQKE